MSRKGIGTWFNFKKMSPPKAVTLVFVASILLIVISYGIWQFGQIISPEGQFSSDPFVHLSVSDYSEGYIPLPNNSTDNTAPDFSDDRGTPITLTYGSDDKLDMARLEIRLDYR